MIFDIYQMDHKEIAGYDSQKLYKVIIIVSGFKK